jgi:hypothetical protein
VCAIGTSTTWLRLGSLDLNELVAKLDTSRRLRVGPRVVLVTEREEVARNSGILKGDKAKTTRSARVIVEHDNAVHYLAKLFKEGKEFLVGDYERER